MKSSRAAVLVLMLAIAMARLSLAATHESSRSSTSTSTSTSITAILGRDLRGFIARAGNLFRSDGGGSWRAANVTAAADGEAKNLRAVAAASRRRRPAARKSAGSGGGGGPRCVSAAACRKRRVICGKRCYADARRGAASINHVPSRCVVKCRKCVPTC